MIIVGKGIPHEYPGILNGDFDADTDWTKVNTTISAGEAHFSVAALLFTPASIAQAADAEIGKTYRVIYTITRYVSSNNVRAFIGGAAGTVRTSTGTFTEDLVAINTNNLVIQADLGAGAIDLSVDNVSVEYIG